MVFGFLDILSSQVTIFVPLLIEALFRHKLNQNQYLNGLRLRLPIFNLFCLTRSGLDDGPITCDLFSGRPRILTIRVFRKAGVHILLIFIVSSFRQKLLTCSIASRFNLQYVDGASPHPRVPAYSACRDL